MFKVRGVPISEQDTEALLEVREEILEMLEDDNEEGNEQDLLASVQICNELDDRGVEYPDPLREVYLLKEHTSKEDGTS